MTTLAERCRQIEALILDVDGVLTSGEIVYNDLGEETKWFHVRDGHAVRAWRQRGKRTAILTGRKSNMVAKRAAELDVSFVEQGHADKAPGYRRLLEQWGLEESAVAYVGDDLADVPIMTRAGLAIAPRDACPEAVDAAHYVTRQPGGRGAVREAIELILHSQQLWHAPLPDRSEVR